MKELFAKKHPKLLEELHPTQNKGIEVSKLYENSGVEVTWQCKDNPKHIWKQKIGNRAVRGYGCPYCSGRLTLPEESFATLFPSIAAELHPSKNNGFDPYKHRPNSDKSVWWKCKRGHVWKQRIRHRVSRKSECRVCRKIENSIVYTYPEIAKEWHPSKNKPLEPIEVNPASNLKVWWQCSKDPSHEWEVRVSTRTFGKSTCPKCGENKTKGRGLPPLREFSPELASQWHPTKNGDLKPSDFTAGSTKKVWWVCSENPHHEWEAQIKNRTILGSGCPHCFKEKNVIRLTEHLYDLTLAEIECYHIFLSNLRILRQLTNHKIPKSQRLSQPYYRMIFSSAITTLETYLLDAFFKTVSKSDQLLQKLIETTPEFSKKQYSLTEVIDWQKNLKKRTTEYLFNIIWHNLSKVQNMYESVLGVVFPENSSYLYMAINIRHDLIHRNGRTKTGAMHSLTKKQILELINEVESFVVHIDTQLKDKKTELRN